MNPMPDNRDGISAMFDEDGEGHEFVLTTRVMHPSINDWAFARVRARMRASKAWHGLVRTMLTFHGLMVRSQPHVVVRKSKLVEVFGRPMFAGRVEVFCTYHWPDRRHHDLWNYPPKFAVDALVGPIVRGDHYGIMVGSHVHFNVDQQDSRMELRIRRALAF